MRPVYCCWFVNREIENPSDRIQIGNVKYLMIGISMTFDIRVVVYGGCCLGESMAWMLDIAFLKCKVRKKTQVNVYVNSTNDTANEMIVK